MNKKLLLGIGAGVLIYWVWSRNKAGKSLNPFAKSSSFAGEEKFFNFSAGCQVYQGSCNAPAGTIIDGNKIIASNTTKSCVVCPRSNTATGMPVSG